MSGTITSGPRKRWRKALMWSPVWVPVGILLLGIAYFLAMDELKGPSDLEFALHRAEYLAIVAEAKALPYTGLIKTSIRGREVCVRRDVSGGYLIAITTRDLGHLGSSGYLFSDGPFKSISGDPYTNIEAPGDLWTATETVEDHWMMIECNLH